MSDTTPSVGTSSVGTAGSLAEVLRIRPFRRLWLCLGLSSLGDWLGFLATTAMAGALATGYRQQNFAIATVLLLRLLPALVAGPLGGILADRLDRRVNLVVGDVLRFGLMLSIPLVGTLTWLFVATVLIECVSLVWMPAKDASVPNLVPRDRLGAANQLFLATTYGSALPAAALFTLMALLYRSTSSLFGEWGSPQDLALFVNSLTFLASALTIVTVKEISDQRTGITAESNPVKVLLDGWRFIRTTPVIRGLCTGIVGAFAAGGVVLGLGRTYVGDLAGGDAGYGVLFGAVFLGLAGGMLFGPKLLPTVSRRQLFAIALTLAGLSMVTVGAVPNIVLVTFLVVVLGFFAGAAWVTGYTLLGLEVADELRGRTFAFVNSVTRLAMAGVLAASPAVAALLGTHTLRINDDAIVSYNGAAMTIVLGGVLATVVGIVSYRQMTPRGQLSLVSQLRGGLGRPLAVVRSRHTATGLFIALEGGDGAGKTTQAQALARWMEGEGLPVLLTHEPGGTEAGARIRRILLDPDTGALDPRAEALLFAADRAEHVTRVIEPALAAGRAVITDRYIDSSLAYQGAGRQLNRQEIARISGWATTGLRPHLTVVLDIDPAASRSRALDRSAADRLEAEDEQFRTAVREQFLDLSLLDSDRYLVVDAAAAPDEVTRRIVERLRLVPEFERAVGAARKNAAMAHPSAPAEPTPGEVS